MPASQPVSSISQMNLFCLNSGVRISQSLATALLPRFCRQVWIVSLTPGHAISNKQHSRPAGFRHPLVAGTEHLPSHSSARMGEARTAKSAWRHGNKVASAMTRWPQGHVQNPVACYSKIHISPIGKGTKKQPFWPVRIRRAGHFLQDRSKLRRLKKRVVFPVRSFAWRASQHGKHWHHGRAWR